MAKCPACNYPLNKFGRCMNCKPLRRPQVDSEAADLRSFAKIVDYKTGSSEGSSGLLEAIDSRASAVARSVFGEHFRVEVYDHTDVSNSIAVDVVALHMGKDPDKGFHWMEAWDLVKDLAKFQSRTGTTLSNLEIRKINAVAFGFHIPIKKARKLYGKSTANIVLSDKPYNPQLNQIKDQMERIRHGMKNKQGDSKKPDKEKLNQLQVRKDRLERVTDVK